MLIRSFLRCFSMLLKFHYLIVARVIYLKYEIMFAEATLILVIHKNRLFGYPLFVRL